LAAHRGVLHSFAVRYYSRFKAFKGQTLQEKVYIAAQKYFLTSNTEYWVHPDHRQRNSQHKGRAWPTWSSHGTLCSCPQSTRYQRIKNCLGCN